MTLRDFLEQFIIGKLVHWQGTEGADGIANLAINTLVNPSANPYKPAFDNANKRMSEVTEELAKQSANISPLVLPRYAALVFEGIFETCVAFWIARGQPPPPQQNQPQQLKPDVERFVKLQVSLFLALVGAK